MKMSVAAFTRRGSGKACATSDQWNHVHGNKRCVCACRIKVHVRERNATDVTQSVQSPPYGRSGLFLVCQHHEHVSEPMTSYVHADLRTVCVHARVNMTMKRPI